MSHDVFAELSPPYSTIVADPPWDYRGGWPVGRVPDGAVHDGRRTPLPYSSMTVADIAALPVAGLAASDAHLYLWTTNRYLFDARRIVDAWGFRYSQLLVWAKTPMGVGPGGAFAQSAEFVLFCKRGSLRPIARQDSVWFNWKRTAMHSAKPPAFGDLVERVSPGPYVELFARAPRLGWDSWGHGYEIGASA
jgi:N6-adenosine-specific RNA methylase IME4